MSEYRKLQLMVFYYNYILALTFISTVFMWFDGTGSAIVMMLILLVVPLCVFLLSKNKAREEGTISKCHFEFLIIVGYFCSFNAPLVCYLMYFAALILFFAWKYGHGKYIVLGRNPSVSENTRERADQNMKHSLRRISVIALCLSIVVSVVFLLIPDVEIPQRKVQTEQAEADDEAERKEMVSHSDVAQKLEEMQEETKNEWILVAIRIIFYIVIVLFALVAIILAGYKLITFFANRKRLGGTSYYTEMVVEKNDNEEYTKLVSVVKEHSGFPDGNDGKVRKMFYRVIKKQAQKKDVDKSLTSDELKLNYMDNVSEADYLTGLYKKARYSEETVTDSELEQLQERRQNNG